MNDLIGRQEAIDALGERPVVWSNNDDYTLGERNQYDMDRLAIGTVPSAEPEIVRCKECKHNPAQEDNCPLPVQYIVPEGYCHLGEIKDVRNQE